LAKACGFALLLLMPALHGCKAPPQAEQAMPMADPERGRRAMVRAGCGACHAIPGVWPRGQVASGLAGIGSQALIAGRLPNRADTLAAFIRNAPAFVPDAGMPAMNLSPSEAHDAAAYLYSLD
jgi:mono/diheme cytochrome c family protein